MTGRLFAVLLFRLLSVAGGVTKLPPAASSPAPMIRLRSGLICSGRGGPAYVDIFFFLSVSPAGMAADVRRRRSSSGYRQKFGCLPLGAKLGTYG